MNIKSLNLKNLFNIATTIILSAIAGAFITTGEWFPAIASLGAIYVIYMMDGGECDGR